MVLWRLYRIKDYGKQGKDKAMIYIQCDTRYNSYITREIEGRMAAEHAVLRAKEIAPWEEVYSCMFDCDENRILGEKLKALGVNVTYSDEEHVNKRFLSTVLQQKDPYIIRVAGDQVLLDAQLMRTIMVQMGRENDDFFFPELSASAIVTDVIRTNVLKMYYEEVNKAVRYFYAVDGRRGVRRYRPPLPQLFFPCRANSDEGFAFAKKVIENHLDILTLQHNLISKISSEKSDLRSSGMWRSWLLGNINNFFYDAWGEVNPWWCESAVNLVKSKIADMPGIRVFEWGTGNSTMFWSRNAKEVVSVEHDQGWYQKMKRLLPDHVRIEYRELVYGGDYCKVILNENELFDIVVIDGRDRVRCAKNSVERLKENGIIIWDNTDRSYYNEGYIYLKERGFKRLELSGIIWGLPGVKDYTSIFYRDNNIWGL